MKVYEENSIINDPANCVPLKKIKFCSSAMNCASKEF